ncbi:hypothetical protein KM043_008541 [Ampulex compressa]|nr:hypothetical protein KM043_008541 [Ampulex compressa]
MQRPSVHPDAQGATVTPTNDGDTLFVGNVGSTAMGRFENRTACSKLLKASGRPRASKEAAEEEKEEEEKEEKKVVEEEEEEEADEFSWPGLREPWIRMKKNGSIIKDATWVEGEKGEKKGKGKRLREQRRAELDRRLPYNLPRIDKSPGKPLNPIGSRPKTKR